MKTKTNDETFYFFRLLSTRYWYFSMYYFLSRLVFPSIIQSILLFSSFFVYKSLYYEINPSLLPNPIVFGLFQFHL